MKAAEISRMGLGVPAYFNDGSSFRPPGTWSDPGRRSRYGIIGCVEPQVGGKTEGWHDAAFSTWQDN
jgi:formate C-acetyltransferase